MYSVLQTLVFFAKYSAEKTEHIDTSQPPNETHEQNQR